MGKGFEDNHTRSHSKTGPNRGTVHIILPQSCFIICQYLIAYFFKASNSTLKYTKLRQNLGHSNILSGWSFSMTISKLYVK